MSSPAPSTNGGTRAGDDADNNNMSIELSPTQHGPGGAAEDGRESQQVAPQQEDYGHEQQPQDPNNISAGYLVDDDTTTSPTTKEPIPEQPVVVCEAQAHDEVVKKQIESYEKMLLESKEALDQALSQEQSRHEQVLLRRENTVRILWWLLLAAHPLAMLLIGLGWWGFYDVHDQVHKWTYNRSFFDVVIMSAVRCFMGIVAVLGTRSDSVRLPYVVEWGYWIAHVSFWLNIGKLMMISWDSTANITCGVVSMVVSTILFGLHQPFAQLDTDEWQDDDDEKEATMKRQRLHQEASARADAIRRRLVGDALIKHDLQEKKRIEAYDYVEKQLVRAKITKRAEERISFFQFLGFLRPYFWPRGNKSFFPQVVVLISLILLGGSKACSIIAPLYIGYAVDELVSTSEMPWNDIAIYVSLTFAAQLLKQVQSAIYLLVRQRAFVEISSGVMQHLLLLDHTFHTKRSTGKIVRSVQRGMTSIENVISYLFLLVVPSMVEAVVVFVIFFTKLKSGLLASIIFMHLVAYALITVELTKWRKPIRKRMMQNDNKYHDILTESLLNLDTVKIFNTEQYEVDRYTKAVATFQKYSVSTQVSLSILNTAQQLIINSTLLTCLFITAYQVHLGNFKIGTISTVSAYIASLYAPLSFLGTIYDMFVSSIIDAGAIITLRREPIGVKDMENAVDLALPEDGSAPVVEFKNVCFTYDPASGRGIKDLNLKLQGSVAIVGATGSFKTSLTKLLLRFYYPTSGQILINGQDIREATNSSLKAMTCVVPQNAKLFNDTIINNLRYGCEDATVAEVESACKSAGIYDFITNLPSMFESKVGEGGCILSGGEAQRMNIARALLRSIHAANVQKKKRLAATGQQQADEDDANQSFNGLLIADEATSALDNATEKMVQAALATLQKGTTSITVAHRLTTIMSCSTIIVMSQGSVLELGSHQELLDKGGVYCALWNKQFETPEAADDVEKLFDEVQKDAKPATPTAH